MRSKQTTARLKRTNLQPHFTSFTFLSSFHSWFNWQANKQTTATLKKACRLTWCSWLFYPLSIPGSIGGFCKPRTAALSDQNPETGKKWSLLFYITYLNTFYDRVNVWGVCLAPPNIPSAFVLTLGNKVLLYCKGTLLLLFASWLNCSSAKSTSGAMDNEQHIAEIWVTGHNQHRQTRHEGAWQPIIPKWGTKLLVTFLIRWHHHSLSDITSAGRLSHCWRQANYHPTETRQQA